MCKARMRLISGVSDVRCYDSWVAQNISVPSNKDTHRISRPPLAAVAEPMVRMPPYHQVNLPSQSMETCNF